MAFAAWIPAIATVASSLIASAGQKSANQTNLEIQQNNSAFNAEQAALNRQFQHDETQQAQGYNTEMSATAWQRGVADMKAAGLNPMLAYSQGGASTPTISAPQGSTAQAGAPGNMQNVFASAGQSAATYAGIQQMQAQTEKIQAETAVEKSKMREWDSAEGNWKMPTSWVAQEQKNRSELLWYQPKHEIENIYLNKKQQELVDKQINNAIATGDNIRADTRDTTANAVLRELAQAEARNRQTFQLKYPGYNVDVKPFLGEAANITNSAANAAFKLRR